MSEVAAAALTITALSSHQGRADAGGSARRKKEEEGEEEGPSADTINY